MGQFIILSLLLKMFRQMFNLVVIAATILPVSQGQQLGLSLANSTVGLTASGLQCCGSDTLINSISSAKCSDGYGDKIHCPAGADGSCVAIFDKENGEAQARTCANKQKALCDDVDMPHGIGRKYFCACTSDLCNGSGLTSASVPFIISTFTLLSVFWLYQC